MKKKCTEIKILKKIISMKSMVKNRTEKRFIQFCLTFSLFMVVQISCVAQYRPSLFFREDWKESPAATPVTQEHVANQNLTMTLYGPGHDNIRKSNHDHPVDDPFYIWSGECTGNWAVTLKSKNANVDLTGPAKVIWNSKQSGFRNLRLILKLSDGMWLVSNEYDDQSKDWRIHEFNIMDLKWYRLDINHIYEMEPVENPSLSNVEEIGFTDLMTGGQSNACSRLDWIEVYGKSVNKMK